MFIYVEYYVLNNNRKKLASCDYFARNLSPGYNLKYCCNIICFL